LVETEFCFSFCVFALLMGVAIGFLTAVALFMADLLNIKKEKK